jgi:hypothetical protein
MKKTLLHIKKYGIKIVFSSVTCTGLVSLAQKAVVDGVRQHAKKYISVFWLMEV